MKSLTALAKVERVAGVELEEMGMHEKRVEKRVGQRRWSQLCPGALVLSMQFMTSLKSRFPRLFPALLAVVTIGSAGSYAAYQQLSDGDCCYPGAPCCHPGAACCLRHHAAKK